MEVRRTPEQVEFDQCLLGWTFCNREMLEKKLRRAEAAYRKIEPDVERFDRLNAVRKAYRRLSSSIPEDDASADVEAWESEKHTNK